MCNEGSLFMAVLEGATLVQWSRRGCRGRRVEGGDSMRVDAGTTYLYASPRIQAAAGGSAATSFAMAVDAAKADNIKQANFSGMTRQEMRDWVDRQIRSGEMSLEDSFPFMAMTMKIPVAGGNEVPAESDGARYDFMQRAREGIEGARARNDQATLKQLQSALSAMQQNQGRTIGVDVRA